jgi:hypothetical protein
MLPVGSATAVLTFSKRKANPMTYAIEPHNEPDGEGNGWCVCALADATSWAVFLYDDLIEAFPTEAQALAYVALAEGKADDNWRVS